MKLSIHSLYSLLIITMPIGLSGIGLIEKGTLNISVSDFLLLPFLLLIVYAKYNSLHTNTFITRTLNISIGFVLIFALGFINVFRFDFPILESLIDTLKIITCVAYVYTIAIYLSSNNSLALLNFYKSCTISALLFSISCIIGVILFFAGIPNVFIDQYENSFRAIGFQEDPNLACSFQLISLIYAYKWWKISGYRHIRVIALIIFIGAITTCSKTGMITILLCSIIYLYYICKLRIPTISLNSLVITIVSLALISTILISNEAIYTSFIGRFIELISGNVDIAMTGRADLWSAALNILMADPVNIIFGVGIGQFQNAGRFYSIIDTSHVPHNTFLYLWVSSGFSVVAYVSTCFFILYRSCQKIMVRERDIFWLFTILGLFVILMYSNSVNFQNNRMVYVFLCHIYWNIYHYYK